MANYNYTQWNTAGQPAANAASDDPSAYAAYQAAYQVINIL